MKIFYLYGVATNLFGAGQETSEAWEDTLLPMNQKLFGRGLHYANCQINALSIVILNLSNMIFL